MTTEQEFNDKLKQTAGKHLRSLENWARQQPTVEGVPVIQALMYDLIQVTNQAYLSTLLKTEGEQVESGQAGG